MEIGKVPIDVWDFLIALFSGASGFLEGRLIKAGGRPIQRFFPLPIDGLPWEDIEAQNKAGFSVYFGVCPRKREGGTKEDVGWVPALWADLDAKDFVGGIEETLKRFDTLPSHLYPSIIVASGNGFHAYWLMREPEAIENKEDIRRIEGYLKGLVKFLGGDHTHDLSRVMRLPGTMNIKDPANPVPCRIIHFEPDKRFNLSDFDEFWIDPGEAGAKAVIGDVSRELPERFKTLLAKNRRIKDTWEGKRHDLQDQSGSGYDMAMADLLVAHGFRDQEIASVLVNMPSGKGREAADAYLAYTIGKARASASKQREVTPEHGFRLIEAKDLLSMPELETDWLWEGILPTGGLSLLAAKPKVGKTTLALNLAVAVSRGKEFLGRKTRQGAVVYLALEEKKGEVQKRLTSLGVTTEPISFHFGPAPQDAMKGVQPLIKQTGARLLVVDVLQKFCRVRDLNDYSQVTRALEPLMATAREEGCHILLTHHAGKADRPDGDDILGSTGLLGGVDTSIHIKKREQRRTFFTIQRYGEDIPETVINLRPDGSLEALGSRQEIEVEEAKPLILEALTEAFEIKDIYERLGKDKALVSRVLKLLVEEEKVQRSRTGRKGDPYRYQKASFPPSPYTEGSKEEMKTAPK